MLVSLVHHMSAGCLCPHPADHVECVLFSCLFPLAMIIWQKRFRFKDSSCVKALLCLCDTKEHSRSYLLSTLLTSLTSSTRYVTLNVSMTRLSFLTPAEESNSDLQYNQLYMTDWKMALRFHCIILYCILLSCILISKHGHWTWRFTSV